MNPTDLPRNVFVLCTGRCGSTTFIQACGHITNFTAGHETRVNRLGEQRLAYPVGHIEADNRLSWCLGRLDAVWGKDAHYVHLTRNPDDVAVSLRARMAGGIMAAYKNGILLRGYKEPRAEQQLAICHDYIDTVTANIRHFLRDKPHQSQVRLEQVAEDFPAFWQAIGAEGDLAAAMAQWSIRHNATKPAYKGKAG